MPGYASAASDDASDRDPPDLEAAPAWRCSRLLSAFTPLSIDMYLPALPVIAADLRGTAGDIQLTLSAFLVAFGFGQIFYGPAGDRFGRRPVILTGLATYIVASIGCAFAAEAGHLVLLRLLQGLAACGGVVLARTMVRDLAEKDQAARAMSLMHACSSIAPMLAPLIGGQVLWFFGWRAIFWVLAGIGVLAWTATWLRLPETLRPEYRQPLHLGSVLKRYGELVRHRAFMGYALTGAFQFGALFSFLSGSPFVFIERYGIEPRALRPDLRRPGDVPDRGQPDECPLRAEGRRPAHAALRRHRAGDRRPSRVGDGARRGAAPARSACGRSCLCSCCRSPPTASSAPTPSRWRCSATRIWRAPPRR